MNPANNPPVTAAGLATVVQMNLAAFTNMTTVQTSAVGAAVFLVAAWVASRFTTPAKWV